METPCISRFTREESGKAPGSVARHLGVANSAVKKMAVLGFYDIFEGGREGANSVSAALAKTKRDCSIG